jgi:hypothetical protein
VTERVLPIADGAGACPFVAFEDDRDERGTVPDHRHRCYAEPRPAPRALAHQEAYCLSTAFPVCPIFQDWARREAARARSDGGSPRPAAEAAAAASAAAAGGASSRFSDAERPAAHAATGGADARDRADSDEPAHDDDLLRDGARDDAIQRNPPRDWAAPPPWLASRDRPTPEGDPPGFLGRREQEAGRGLAGSSADRLAGYPRSGDEDEDGDEPWTASGASAAAARAAAAGSGLGATGAAARAGAVRPGRSTSPGRPASRPLDDASWRGAPMIEPDELDDDEAFEEEEQPRRPARRPRAYDQHLGGPDGPDWERPRRYEAYPTIKTRVGLPNVPRLAMLAGLVVLLAVGLYFLPAVLGLGSGTGSPGDATPRPSGAVARTPAPTPTVPPAPTPSVYTIKRGDTLSKIAKANGITVEELLAANPAIKDPNKVSEGQQIVLPVPSEPPPDEIEGSAEPS